MSFKENINQSSERLISSKFLFLYSWALQVVQTVKNLPVIWETWVQTLGWEDLLEKGMGGLSTILAWRIPWIEDPGKLKLIGLQRVGPFLTTFTFSLFWYNALFYSFITYLSCFLILLLITRDQITKIHRIIKKAREFQKNIYFCFIDYAKLLTVWITINCGKSERDGDTRPPELPLEKPICRSGHNCYCKWL